MLSDIVFEVENEEIHAHKIILACRCEYFKALCTSILFFVTKQVNYNNKKKS